MNIPGVLFASLKLTRQSLPATVPTTWQQFPTLSHSSPNNAGTAWSHSRNRSYTYLNSSLRMWPWSTMAHTSVSPPIPLVRETNQALRVYLFRVGTFESDPPSMFSMCIYIPIFALFMRLGTQDFDLSCILEMIMSMPYCVFMSLRCARSELDPSASHWNQSDSGGVVG